jgi:hypothetical protein
MGADSQIGWYQARVKSGCQSKYLSFREGANHRSHCIVAVAAGLLP